MIETLLAHKNARERAEIKGIEIEKRKTEIEGRYESKEHGVRVEIRSVKKITGGVEVFARAWKGRKQLGFGKDGTVEIERFLIYNPPVLVDDPNGTIVRKGGIGVLSGEIIPDRHLREDPAEAIRQVIAHNVTLVGKEFGRVIKRKIGNTTSTFYPDADPESTSVDGFVKSAVNSSWATVHDAASGVNSYDALAAETYPLSRHNGTAYDIYRSFILFDTSSIPDGDTIDSAILSMYTLNVVDGSNDAQSYIVIVSSSPASNTAIVNGDYNQVGSIDFGKVDMTIQSINTYTDFTLNTSGIANISKTGISKFGAREGHDFENIAIANSTTSYIRYSQAETTGTSNDPKLVVVHSVASTAYTKTLTEALTASDTISRITGKISSEAMTIVDTIVSLKTLSKIVSEAVATVDSISTMVGRIFYEALSVIDIIPNESVPGVWSSGGSLSVAKGLAAGAGTQSTGLSFGGNNGSNLAITEEYNGASWSAGGSLNTAVYQLAGCGTQTAGLSFGGYWLVATTEEYNGTTWSVGGSLASGRGILGGAGTQSAGLSFGGNVGSSTSITEEYNGTTWSAGGALATARYILAGAGTQSAGLCFGGSVSGAGTLLASTEEYNGTTWSAGGNLAVARQGLAGAGTQSAGLSFGGTDAVSTLYATTEEYNGTLWSAGGNLAVARRTLSGAGTQTAGLSFDGYDPNTTAITEEYNSAISLYTRTQVLLETISITDIIKTAMMKVLSEIMTIVDTFVRLINTTRTFSESITTVGTFIKQTSKNLLESVRVIDGKIQNTGVMSPGTVVNDTSFGNYIWSNPTNAEVSDNVYATSIIPANIAGTSSNYLKATNFGFNIPINSNINGIKVEVEKKADSSSGGGQDKAVRIVKGGVVGSTDNSDLTHWTTTDTYFIYGSAFYLWGEIWTPADINNSLFGFAISVGRYSSLYSVNSTQYVDHIRITVYYSTVEKSLGKILTNILSIADTATTSKLASKIISETITITDTIIKKLQAVFSEVVALADTIATSKVTTKIFSEVVSIADTIKRITGRILSETITAVDTIIRQVGMTISESINAVDSVSLSKATAKVFSEVVSVADTILKTAGKILSEAVTVTDTIYHITSRILTETITVADTMLRQTQRIISEVVSVVDNISTSKVAAKVISETIALVDSIITQTNKVKTFLESLVITDTISNLVGKVFAEVLTVADTISRLSDRIFSETVTMVDSMIKTINTTKLFVETITVIDASIRQTGRIFVEAISVVDATVSVLKSTVKQLSETITITGTMIRSMIKTFSESIVVVDTVVKTLQKVFAETLTIVDTILNKFSKTFSEIVVVTDTNTMSRLAKKTLSELLTLTEIFTKRMILTFSETISITSSFVRQIGNVFVETIAITDIITKRIGKVLTQTITITDVWAFFMRAKGLIFGLNKNINLSIGTRDEVKEGKNNNTDIGQGTSLR